MRTTTDEISLYGCYIETMFTIDVGTKLTVALLINGEAIHAAGVGYQVPRVGNGIDFTQIHPNDTRKLKDSSMRISQKSWAVWEFGSTVNFGRRKMNTIGGVVLLTKIAVLRREQHHG